MKAALFSIVPYERPVAHQGWPVQGLSAGILELAFIAPSPDKRRRSIELFGEQVLPRMRDL